MSAKNTDAKEIPWRKILIIIKEILEIIIGGMPEEEAIAQASKKYNIKSSVLKDALKKYRA